MTKIEIFIFIYIYIYISFVYLISLSRTNIEEQIVSSYLVHGNNYQATLTEFALRLQISLDDPSTKELFKIFDTVIILFFHLPRSLADSSFLFYHNLQDSTNTIDLRKYLHCALFIIKSDVPVIELIQLVAKLYDDCGKGPGRLTRNSLYLVLSQTMALSVEEHLEIFERIDVEQRDYVTIGIVIFEYYLLMHIFTIIINHLIHILTDEVIEYIRNKPEYEFVFATDANNRSSKSTKQEKSL